MERTKSDPTCADYYTDEDFCTRDQEKLAIWMSEMCLKETDEHQRTFRRPNMRPTSNHCFQSKRSFSEYSPEHTDRSGSYNSPENMMAPNMFGPQLALPPQSPPLSIYSLIPGPMNYKADPAIIFDICAKRVDLVAGLIRSQETSNNLSAPLRRKVCKISRMDLRAELPKVIKICVGIGGQIVADFILRHTKSFHMVSHLWKAVRQRGCQFLGPAVQEEVLHLVVYTMEDGAELTRKVLIMFLVGRLKPYYPKIASRTAVGHVVQILYRAGCFDIIKVEGQSCLMRLKEEFRDYEPLRREHDAQLITIGLEAGLRIAPEQWSSILYGDSDHRHILQSTMDKLKGVKPSFDMMLGKLKSMMKKQGDPNGIADVMVYFDQLAYMGRLIEQENWQTPENLAMAIDAINFIVIKFLSFSKPPKRITLTSHPMMRRRPPLHHKLSE